MKQMKKKILFIKNKSQNQIKSLIQKKTIKLKIKNKVF